jgi:hypothetical protein
MSTAKATFITRASNGDPVFGMWWPSALLDRSARAREVIRERRGREEKRREGLLLPGELRTGCALGDVVM